MFCSKIKFVLLVFPFIFLSVNGYKWKKEQISDPMKGPPPHCNLENSGSPLCDPDSVLNKNEIEKIIQKQERIASLGSCVCESKCPKNEQGLIVGVLVLKEFDDSSYKKAPGSIENPLQELADYVHKSWNLGTCGNSILIACAVNERLFALSVGEQAYKVLNKTWINGIFEENFRGINSKSFNAIEKINHVLYMYEEAIKEELKSNSALAHSITSVEQSTTNLTFYITTILTILVFTITILFCVVAALNIFKQRKENDDVSIKDVWTRKFWLKAGNQYKAAKQTEVPEQDLEKNEPVKSNLASTEDLKDSVENINETTKPKLSKV